MATVFINSTLDRRETDIKSESGLIAKLRVISQMAQFQGACLVLRFKKMHANCNLVMRKVE
jgi:hypothetical protein